MSRTFVVLDIKSDEISGISARWGRNHEYIIDGFAREQSKGICKGRITDQNAAIRSIEGITNKLAEMSAGKIYDVFITVSSPSIEMVSSSGTILLSKYGKVITASDIRKCVDIASIIKLPHGKEPIHKIVKDYKVDGAAGVKTPVGLEAVKFGVDMEIVLIDFSIMRNLTKCVYSAGLSSPRFIFSGVSNAYRVLSEEEFCNGTMLLNACKSSSEISVFKDKKMVFCRVFPFSVNDHGPNGQYASGENISRLVSDLNDLWQDIRSIIVLSEKEFSDEAMNLIESMTSRPVKMGSCRADPLEELPHDRLGYIGCLGMLDYLKSGRNAKKVETNPIKKAFNSFIKFLDDYF